MPRNPFRPHSPGPEFLARLPKGRSGDRVNRLGETEVRPPHMDWQAPDMDAAPFGEAQKWFHAHEQPDDEMRALRAERHRIVGAPRGRNLACKLAHRAERREGG